jgi:hypothetical protein
MRYASLLAIGLALYLTSPAESACTSTPPTNSLAVTTPDEVYIKFEIVDNDFRVTVNGALIEHQKHRPAPPSLPIHVAIHHVLRTGQNTVIVEGLNERSISETHAKENPWRFRYTVIKGASLGSAGNLFAPADCRGSEQSRSQDLSVMMHTFRLDRT